MRRIVILSLLLTSLLLTVEAKRGKESDAPARVERFQEPCEALSLEPTTNLRAYGTATSEVESVARNQAMRNARSQLALMMKTAIDGAIEECRKSISGGVDGVGESITQAVMQNINGSRPIKWTVYDLSDGTIQACVCVEMVQSSDEELRRLDYLLNQDDVMNSKEDREYFVGQIFKNVEQFRAALRAE